MKQTAVEWFSNEISEIIGRVPFSKEQEEKLIHTLEKAKEMEKQQTIDFSEKHILENLTCNYNGEPICLKEAEQYYNETFNK